MEEKIPVTILTGFLGAGKTTVLNHLIRQYPDKRFAIIENEFGAIGIDQELVVEVDAGIFELSNGCICCTNNGALMDTLWKLMERPEPMDHLLIETTGIAEPDRVAQAFLSEPAIQQAFQLYHTITIVDAVFALQTLLERPEAHRQIAFADILVINKVDLAKQSQVESLAKELAAINPFAKTVKTANGQLPKEWLQYKAYEKEIVTRDLPIVASRSDSHGHAGIVSISYTFEAPFDFLKFRHWIHVLLLLQGERIYRVKGILHFAGMDHAMILQTVRQAHVFQKGEEWTGQSVRASKLVFIGPGLKRAPLEKALRSCLAPS